MIPNSKLNAVKKALQETFGVDKFDDIRKLTAPDSYLSLFFA